MLPASATIPAWRPREVTVLAFAASIPVRASSMATGRKMRLSRAPAPVAEPSENDLTPRESEVLRPIAGGKSNREIARALFVSEAAVKTHVNRIFAETGSRDRGLRLPARLRRTTKRFIPNGWLSRPASPPATA